MKLKKIEWRAGVWTKGQTTLGYIGQIYICSVAYDPLPKKDLTKNEVKGKDRPYVLELHYPRTRWRAESMEFLKLNAQELIEKSLLQKLFDSKQTPATTTESTGT